MKKRMISEEEYSHLFFWALFTVFATLILYWFWAPLGSPELLSRLVEFPRGSRTVEYIFRGFTFLGDDAFFLVFLCTVFWCVDMSLGTRLAVVLLSSSLFSGVLKDLFAQPRPAIEGVQPPANFTFPSGHALTAVTLWGYLAVQLQKRIVWVLVVAVVILVGFSRIILGFHFPRDVLGGYLLGIVFLVVYITAGLRFPTHGPSFSLPFPARLALSIGVPVFLLMIFGGRDTSMICGFFAGAAAGYIWEREKLRFKTGGPWQHQALKIILGFTVLFGIVLGANSLLPSLLFPRFLCYGLAGIWVTFGAPFLFLLLGLSRTKIKSKV